MEVGLPSLPLCLAHGMGLFAVVMRRHYTAMPRLRIVTLGVWLAATENGPRTMDKSQTLASYVNM
jgi:hypothetical protein